MHIPFPQLAAIAADPMKNAAPRIRTAASRPEMMERIMSLPATR